MKALLHGHHDTLISWGRDRAERTAQIVDSKPAHEHELRLRLLHDLTEAEIALLPEEIRAARAACVSAWAAYDSAWAAHDSALAAYDSVLAAYDSVLAACISARAAYDSALAACVSAWAAHDSALAAYSSALAAHSAELEAWHAKVCPAYARGECPWDGKSIFPGASHD